MINNFCENQEPSYCPSIFEKNIEASSCLKIFQDILLKNYLPLGVAALGIVLSLGIYTLLKKNIFVLKPPPSLTENPSTLPEKYSIRDQKMSKLCLLSFEKAIQTVRMPREIIPSDLIILDEKETDFVIFDSFYWKPILQMLNNISDKTLRDETARQIFSSGKEKKCDKRILEQALESFPKELESISIDLTSELESSLKNIEIEEADIECPIPEVETIEEPLCPPIYILTGKIVPLSIKIDSLDLKKIYFLRKKS